jgi:hypothetical protein
VTRALLTAALPALQPHPRPIPYLLDAGREEAGRSVLGVNRCEVCGASLEERRRDARYCSDWHRVLASKRRRNAE